MAPFPDHDSPRTRNLPISARLTLWYGLTLFTLLSLYALFSYTSFRSGLERDFDYHLQQETADLLAHVDVGGGTPAFVRMNELQSVAYRTDGYYGTFVRLLSPEGLEVYRSPNYEGHEVLPPNIPEGQVHAALSRTWEGKPVRTAYVPLTDPEGVLRGWLEVSAIEWTLHRNLSRFALELALGGLLIVLLAMGGGYWLARRALAPVAALTAATQRMQAKSLNDRLPINTHVHDELTVLAETFNALLARVEHSFNTERRFTANAAHELLTPLTTMRGELDLALRRQRSPESYRQTITALLEDTNSLIDTVHHLLQLSHADTIEQVEAEPVLLSRVAQEQVSRFQSRAADKGITLSQELQPDVWISAHNVRIGQVISNLLDNAIKYTPEGGHVSVRLYLSPKGACLDVEDTGIGFSRETRPFLFDRFFRADDPAVSANVGSGLGLAIVKKMVEVYEGSVSASSPGLQQGSSFHLCFPHL